MSGWNWGPLALTTTVKAGEQAFIPADKMTTVDWHTVEMQNSPEPEPAPTLFSATGNPESFPTPR